MRRVIRFALDQSGNRVTPARRLSEILKSLDPEGIFRISYDIVRITPSTGTMRVIPGNAFSSAECGIAHIKAHTILDPRTEEVIGTGKAGFKPRRKTG